MLRYYRVIVAMFIGLFVTVFFNWHNAAISAPLLANYYLPWKISAAEVPNLAKWDLLILDMETQITSRPQIEQIRKLNPDIIILAYVTSQEILDSIPQINSSLRRELAAGIAPQWYLARSSGERIVYWPGTTMLNPSNLSPSVGGLKWNDYLANFMTEKVLSSGLWNGVFYDNAWGGVKWFTGDNVDYNRDGAIDKNLDEEWRAGLKHLFNETRRLAQAKIGKDIMIVGNGLAEDYTDELNGMMIESFQNHNWNYAVKVYKFQQNGAKLPRAVVINNNNNNSGRQDNYQNVRYGLASTLVAGNGYYSFDDGNKGHHKTWWYDEYDVNLGAPLSAEVKNGAAYRRDFENGVAIINPTEQAVVVDLQAEYEKIIGTQDKAVNSGGIVSKLNLPGKDGIILRRTFQDVSNVFFINGGLARFFTPEGKRSRNAFFAFTLGFAGGDMIYKGDLNGLSGFEKIAGEGFVFYVLDSAGRIWQNSWPFFDSGNPAATPPNLNLAVGELERGKGKRIVLAGDRGGAVLVTTYFGAPIYENKYPLSAKYKNGFSTAIGDVDGGDGEIILGMGAGGKGEVLVMDATLTQIKKRFYPYGALFRGAVFVGAGDIDNDGKAEILTAATVADKINVKIFTGNGKKLKEFSAGTALGSSRFSIGTADVDGDGKLEVVVGSN